MKIIYYTSLALASVLLFAQCDKKQNIIEDPEEIIDPDEEDDTNNPNPEPLPYPDASEWAHWEEGEVFYGMNEWSEVIVGDIPLVLSAPHDGDIVVPGVQRRDNCYPPTDVAVGRDSHTRALTYEVADHFEATYGVRPTIIINHLHRSNIDQNRNNVQNGGDAFCPGEAEMEKAWYDFHNFIDTALWKTVTDHGYALYIDMHAHGHPIKRLEIGYRLSDAQLRAIHNRTRLVELMQRSSIRDMFEVFGHSGFRDFIMGDNAFGTLMENEGIPSVPSLQQPHSDGNPFFSGGYNTVRYTGGRNPNHAPHGSYPYVYGFQIEHDSEVRTVEKRPGYVEKLVKVLWEEYMPLTKPQ